ncbi:MAG: endonuclease/exonuclease/phosphatase family protein [Candidatus Brachytrichaceae bacterium NZ_4S206]|jgi:endonuclease/exonuclease/phosphatase family metal-dependent hydrolase
MTLFRPAFAFALLAGFCFSLTASAQVSNLAVRVMAANLTSGNFQSYETPGINILKGLKPDVVAINEFRYNNSTNHSQARALVDLALGTNFHFFKEVAPGYTIPNGIISRWPILEAGTWNDTQVPDRGFAWARIDLPGTNDLYVVSAHLHAAGGPSSRAIEATNLKALIQSHFPTNAWLIVAGDFNTDSRSESAMTTFKTFLSDDAVPVDQAGDPDTNAGRNKPYDYVLPSFSLVNFLTPVVIGTNSFPAGLVFDSRVYTPLSDVPPVVSSDSDALNMQHMAVVKNFLLPVWETNPPPSAPVILVQPQSQTHPVGATAQFFVTAEGAAPLAYQWRLFGTNLPGATAPNLIRSALTTHDAGPYTVVVTNAAGAVTSSVAVLTVIAPATNSYNGLLAGWDVSGLTNFGPSPLPPTTLAPGVGATGLIRGAGVTTMPTAAGRAWGGNGFNATSATDAVVSNDFVFVTLSAPPGHQLSLSAISRFDYRRSGTGPTSGLLQFAVGDSSFADITTLTFPSTVSSGASLGTVDLSGVPALQAVPPGTNVTLRLVLFGGSNASGTWYVFDTLNSTNLDLAIEGALAPVNPPGAPLPPTLVQPAFTNGAFHFTLTGTTGVVYVVQSATHPAAGPWLGRATNAAPFVFTETNGAAVPARFYRGVLPP